MKAFDLVGSTPEVPGVNEGLVCGECDGDGLLETEEREQIQCDKCRGTGGTDPEAVARARKFSDAYREALFGGADQ